MRVVYATSDLDHWINVAKNMQNKMNWEPIYWITAPKNKSIVQKSFPLAVCQGYIDAVRGKYTKIDKREPKIVLDKDMLEKYFYYEKISLKMMDRMDPTAYSFNLSERVDLYYEFLEYWLNTVAELKPDCVLFSESPHGLFSYILYAVCIENKIKILRFAPTYIEGLTFLTSSLHDTPFYLKQEYAESLKKYSYDKSLKIANSYLDKNRGSYKKALPYYMKEIIEKRTLKDNINIILGKINRFVKNKINLPYKKSASSSIRDNITNFDFLLYKYKGYFVKNNLQKVYNSLTEPADLAKPYIYVALHYQPEKTTSPEGGIFVDQWLMISMLSSLVADDWQVYVKEHISQFSNKLHGEQGRSSNFYIKVSQMKNVKLIKSNISSFDLIDNAKAVATVTGTVGLEAAIRSKPVLSFGYAWYELCHGVIGIKNSQDLKDALSSIENGYELSDEKVNAFLYTIERISSPCYINPGNKVSVDCSEEENIYNLTESLIRFAHKI